jgi:hypothetical protein
VRSNPYARVRNLALAGTRPRRNARTLGVRLDSPFPDRRRKYVTGDRKSKGMEN